jgi:hypothetical protein
LEKANTSATIEEAIRYDSDTTGAAGSPDIAATIFEKVSLCEVAVFDVTPISFLEGPPRKSIPNPNVMIELGYAAHAIGWERIVTVMNTAFGGKPEELPFDVRSRRFPQIYSLGDERQVRPETDAQLAGGLWQRIGLCLEALHAQVERALRRLNRDCLTFLDVFGPHEYFNWDLDKYGQVIDRLLDLKLIYCNSDPMKKAYAYHWTHLGKRVHSEYRKRESIVAEKKEA